MVTKTFETLFKITAKYLGAPAFVKVNRDLKSTVVAAGKASKGIDMMFTSLKVGLAGVATYAGYKAFRAIFDIGGAALDAAGEVRKATDNVRKSYARMIPQGRLKPEELEALTQETLALAQAMEKAGGIDAEDFAQSLANLASRVGLSSKEIKEAAKGYTDYLVRVHKGIPTLDQMAESEEAMRAWMVSGRPAFMRDLGWSKERIVAFNKQIKATKGINAVEARRQVALKELNKETGEMAAFNKTDAGALYRLNQAQEEWNETAGESGAAAVPELNKALAELYGELLPVAKLINEELAPNIKELTQFLRDNKEEFKAWSEIAVKAINFVLDNITKLKYLSPTFWLMPSGTTVKGIVDRLSGKESATNVPTAPAVPGTGQRPEAPIDVGGGMAAEMQKEEEARKRGVRSQSPYGPEGVSKPISATGPVSNAILASQRSAFRDELTNPAVREKLLKVAKAEVGTSNPARTQAFLETVVNRAKSRGQTLDRALNADYYDTLRPHYGPLAKPSAAETAALQSALENTLGGGNVSNLATGNWSGAPGRGLGGPHGYNTKMIGREQFSVQSADTSWAKRTRSLMQQPKPAAASPNVSMNSPITINGVSADRQGAVGREVAHAIQRSNKVVLDELKRARADSVRLGYV